MGVDPLIDAERLAGRVRELASAISKDYPDLDRPLLLVGVLKGAYVFLADLARAIDRDVEIDFVELSSYRESTSTPAEIRVRKSLSADVRDKDVIIIEDILDTGRTLRFGSLIESIRDRQAASVKVCVLLNKHGRRRVEISADYCGFEIANQFVVGYGMDAAERFRNLPYIGVLTESDNLRCLTTGARPIVGEPRPSAAQRRTDG